MTWRATFFSKTMRTSLAWVMVQGTSLTVGRCGNPLVPAFPPPSKQLGKFFLQGFI